LQAELHLTARSVWLNVIYSSSSLLNEHHYSASLLYRNNLHWDAGGIKFLGKNNTRCHSGFNQRVAFFCAHMAEEVLIDPNGKSRGVSNLVLLCILNYYYNNTCRTKLTKAVALISDATLKQRKSYERERERERAFNDKT